MLTEFYGWLKELPYPVKAGFSLQILGILSTQCAKGNFMSGEIEPTQSQIEHWKTQETGIVNFYDFFVCSDVQFNLR